MKKTLIAMAAVAVAGTASAQSSVTLFGVVDSGFSYYSATSEYYNLPGLSGNTSAKQSQTALSNSGYNSSRLGFRGTEDLGGGWAANFWLESPVNSDSAVGNVAFSRRSTVSLSSPYGELRMGRDYTSTFWNDGVFDPMTVSGVGVNLIAVVNGNLAISRALATGGLLNGGSSAGTDSYLRTSNMVGYFLPAGLGGFYGQVQYAFHENTDVSNVPGSPSKRGAYAGARGGWTNDKLDIAVAYGESTVADTLTVNEKIKSTNLGASYDFGVVKIFGELSQVKDQRDTPVIGINDKYNGGLVGLTIPVGAALIRASYAQVDYKNGSPVFNGDASVNKLALGVVYNLSKRTALYATAAHVNVKDGHNNPSVMGVTTAQVSNPAILPQPTYVNSATQQPGSAMGYDFGIRHAF
jgi:predicted porin